ncbi:hypothetical protein [Halomicrococcus sp. SG-WS-1]|uniref:hypothetical protein n=1 Tax=Halomicrococcus sp. SG-WS-1 TaxID=3439057 RepID=UPI003F7B012A
MNATRAGLWLVVVGLLLFVGAAATVPSGGCATVESASDVATCATEPGYGLVYGGLGVAIVGVVVWAAGTTLTLVRSITT